MKIRSMLLLSFMLVTLLAVSVSQADDWPQWMGPKRDGVWREKGIVKAFPETGPKVLWRVPIGAGYTGPAVAGGRVYVMDRQKPDPNAGPRDPFQRGSI